MDEYISKQAFKDKYLCCGYLPEMSETKFDTFPAAEVVEVVRCRECKRWDTDPDSYGKDDGPKGMCMKFFEDTYSDDFCSYGQRKIETILPKSDAKDEGLEGDHEIS